MVHSFFEPSAASTMYLCGEVQSAGVPRAGEFPEGEMIAAVEIWTATTNWPVLIFPISEKGKLEGKEALMSHVPALGSMLFVTVNVDCFTALAPLNCDVTELSTYR